MPLEAPPLPAKARAEALSEQFAGAEAEDVLRFALTDPAMGRTALVSSFGAEAVVLLHMAAQIAPGLPVLFLDTGLLFPETLQYQKDVSAALGLTDVRVLRPNREALFARDPDGILHVMDPGACCRLRKVEPLAKALDGFDAWVTGRKRFQGGQRVGLPLFEADQGRIKVNPLAHWSKAEIEAYIDRHALPRHPLARSSLPSLGCAPCTSEIAPGEDPRAGRWRGQEKTECGIHFQDGQVERPVA